MLNLLLRLLQYLFTGLGGTILTGMGLGLISGSITLFVINHYIGKITAQAGFLGDMAAILHLGGMDTAISIVIGAIVVRATLLASKLSLTKLKR